MKIFGTICNSKNQNPIKDVNIRFSIEGTEITLVISNEHGKYEYIAEQDYIGQTLDFAIQKDGFERKNISYEIDKDEIKADILLNEIETEEKETEEVIENTRIFGTIRNSVNCNPVQEASIKLSIEGTQIADIISNQQGEYEYMAEQDYTGQTLDISIKKDNYIKKNISYEIDKPTIKSDILTDEIKIEIKGKICNETDNPLDNANISFSIGNSTIDLTSDKDGSFSFTIGQQFLNQTIGYEVNKEGFKITSGKLKLLENLKCINISKTIPPTAPDKSMWIKVAAVGTVLTVAVVVLFALPLLQDDLELSTNPDPIDFDFVPGTGAQTFSIWNDGDGTLEWDVYSDRDWIIVSPVNGTDSGIISVSVSIDGMDPGRYTGKITVESDWGTETGRISLYIPEPEPTRGPTAEPTRETTAEPTLGAPRIDYFRANPEHIDIEGQTTLSWEVSGATSVTIDGVGPVEVSDGSIDRWVEQTTTFTLRATNDVGVSDERDITVYVKPMDSPLINYFIANPKSISPGEKSTLRWDVSGVETVTIDNRIGKKGGIANTEVTLNETTFFILEAENDVGKDVETVMVNVSKPILTLDWDPPSFYFFCDYYMGDWHCEDEYVREKSELETFSISNSGNGNLNWEIQPQEGWITINPNKGVNNKTITIGINTDVFEESDYEEYYNETIYIISNVGTAEGKIYLYIYWDSYFEKMLINEELIEYTEESEGI
jgi:hypothetical protein